MSTPPAFQSQDAPKPLPFDPSKLKGLSEQMIRSHWENNYGGSVKALAAVKARLAQAAGDKDLPPYVYNDLKREHLIRTGSVVLHELYFENLGGSGKAAPAELRRVGGGIPPHRHRVGRGVRVGNSGLQPAHPSARELLDGRPRAWAGRDRPNLGDGHVRALLSDRLRRCGGEVR
jgi:hypothetical protein